MLKLVRLVTFGVIVFVGLVVAGCTTGDLFNAAQADFLPFSYSKTSCDKNNIISDQQMQAQDMTQQQIQKFLESWKGFLATYKPDGKKLASQFIFEAAQKYKISPKVILVTLQKEQGLVKAKKPTQCQLDWAMGWSWPPQEKPKSCGGKMDSNFTFQIDKGTGQFRRYYDNPQKYPFQVGKETKDLDGFKVKPINQSTANLYNYTPYVGEKCGGKKNRGGNGLFWQLWYQDFKF